MLVLGRKARESILIDDAIKVTILAIEGNQVRVGIEAPSDVPIRREELLCQWRDQRPRPSRPRRKSAPPAAIE